MIQDEFELKSKNGKLTSTIADRANSKIIERISLNQNPNFFILTHIRNWCVNDFLIIPKQFFITEIIIIRNPLRDTASRADWICCNIDISKIAYAGNVYLFRDAKEIERRFVETSFKKTLFLREKRSEAKEWILDKLSCVDLIKNDSFTFDEVYKFEEKLRA